MTKSTSISNQHIRYSRASFRAEKYLKERYGAHVDIENLSLLYCLDLYAKSPSRPLDSYFDCDVWGRRGEPVLWGVTGAAHYWPKGEGMVNEIFNLTQLQDSKRAINARIANSEFPFWLLLSADLIPEVLAENHFRHILVEPAGNKFRSLFRRGERIWLDAVDSKYVATYATTPSYELAPGESWEELADEICELAIHQKSLPTGWRYATKEEEKSLYRWDFIEYDWVSDFRDVGIDLKFDELAQKLAD